MTATPKFVTSPTKGDLASAKAEARGQVAARGKRGSAARRARSDALNQVLDDLDFLGQDDAAIEVVSMDDDILFGPLMHRYSLRQAINDGVIRDYIVVPVFVDKAKVDERTAALMTAAVEHGAKLKDGEAARTVMQEAAFGLLLQDIDDDIPPIRRIVSYHADLDNAEGIRRRWEDGHSFIGDHDGLVVQHVNGSHSGDSRREMFKKFVASPRALLTNHNVLVHGLNIDNIDAEVFADPRDSVIGIIQAIGRGLRLLKGPDGNPLPQDRQRPLVVAMPIPVSARNTDDLAEAIGTHERADFSLVLSVLRSLRLNDEAVEAMLRDYAQRAIFDKGWLTAEAEVELGVATSTKSSRPKTMGDIIKARIGVCHDETVVVPALPSLVAEKLATALGRRVADGLGDILPTAVAASVVRALQELLKNGTPLSEKRLGKTVNNRANDFLVCAKRGDIGNWHYRRIAKYFSDDELSQLTIMSRHHDMVVNAVVRALRELLENCTPISEKEHGKTVYNRANGFLNSAENGWKQSSKAKFNYHRIAAHFTDDEIHLMTKLPRRRVKDRAKPNDAIVKNDAAVNAAAIAALNNYLENDTPISEVQLGKKTYKRVNRFLYQAKRGNTRHHEYQCLACLLESAAIERLAEKWRGGSRLKDDQVTEWAISILRDLLVNGTPLSTTKYGNGPYSRAVDFLLCAERGEADNSRYKRFAGHFSTQEIIRMVELRNGSMRYRRASRP
jgi:hypothetical protein